MKPLSTENQPLLPQMSLKTAKAFCTLFGTTQAKITRSNDLIPKIVAPIKCSRCISFFIQSSPACKSLKDAKPLFVWISPAKELSK